MSDSQKIQMSETIKTDPKIIGTKIYSKIEIMFDVDHPVKPQQSRLEKTHATDTKLTIIF